MSKRINQVETDNTFRTFTKGSPRGSLPNFDVSIESSPTWYKKGTNLVIRSGNKRMTLNGRNARTLQEVLNRHFETIE